MDAQAEALSKYSSRLLQWPNVIGVGRGMKVTGRRRTDREAIVVLVTEKMPQEELPAYDVIPQQLGESVLTDVVEVGFVRVLPLLQDEIPLRHGRQRPAPGGVSVGHPEVTAGTLGMVVRDAKTKDPLILSNSHVLANTTSGTDGRAAVNDPVLQPGPYDGGVESDDVIGRLKRFIPILPGTYNATCPRARGFQSGLNFLLHAFFPDYSVRFQRMSNADNLVDAAVAQPLDPEMVSFDIIGLGSVRGTRDPEVGLRVTKSGRSSGVNRGEITVIDASIKVHMGDVGEVLFREQILTQPMASPGDSGSVLLDDDRRAVGLLSAGSQKISVASRMDNVFRLLAITI
ncbi:MAG: hypothetical protein R6U70_02410 [Bacillota bacterium]